MVGSFKEYVTTVEARLLTEAGFSKLSQIMAGLVPSVRTFAIITWENPMGNKLPRSENEIKNRKLEEHLRRGVYGFRHIKGKYGNVENPFFIMNISRKDAVEIGRQGKQESIVFGNVHSPYDITFKLIYCFEDKTYERHVWKSLDKDVGDFYSEYKGKKFVIPFFDDAYTSAEYKHTPQGVSATGITKPELEKLPPHESYNYNIFYAKDFDDVIVNEINVKVDSDILNENLTGKHHWLTRGFTFEKLKSNRRQ